MRRKVSYTPIIDTHNKGSINLIVSMEKITGISYGMESYSISSAQAKRINRFYFGRANCRCCHSDTGCVESDWSRKAHSIMVKYCK